jgi:hypothetical protein
VGTGVMSVATKLLIQMVTKIGAAPWSMQDPYDGVMVVGFHVYMNVVTIVGSTNGTFTKNSSAYSICSNKLQTPQALCDGMNSEFFCKIFIFFNSVLVENAELLTAYKEANKQMPRHIVLYQEGRLDVFLSAE